MVLQAEEKQVFISYSKRDRRFSEKIYSRLVAAGVSVWIDKFEIKAGHSIQGRIEEAISNASYVIVVLSPNSVSSAWVTDELRLAMTRQRDEARRLVVPLVYKECAIPPFLKDRLYIDFRNRHAFEKNFQLLLAALDFDTKQLYESYLRNEDTPPTFIESLLDIDEKGFSDWINILQELPLFQILTNVLRFSSCPGRIKDNILTTLTLVSHIQNQTSFHNLNVLLGFLRDVQIRKITNLDILETIVAIVENRSIALDYRLFTLLFLTRIFNSVSDRREKNSLLPKLFPSHGFDPLSDRLLTDFMAMKEDTDEDLLSKLWVHGSVHYRKEILDYIIAVSAWEKSIDVTESLLSNTSPEKMKRIFLPSWQGIKHTLTGWSEVVDILNIDDERLTPEIIIQAIETSSKVSDDEKIKIISKINVLLSSSFTSLRDRYGAAATFKLLCSIVASPLVDPATSLVTLLQLIQEFDIDSLQYDCRFPSCLLMPKPRAFYKENADFSILGGLVQCVAHDSEDKVSLLLLVRLLDMYSYPAVFAAILMEINEIASTSPQLELLKKFLQGDVTASSLLRQTNKEAEANATENI